MAIEHLHLDVPFAIEKGQSPFELTDQLLARYASELVVLEPGTYDMTPRDTHYEDRFGQVIQVVVTDKGTGTCGALPRPGQYQTMLHPVRGEVPEQRLMHLPDTVTQTCIVAMRKANQYRQRGLPHIFEILRWRSDDDTLSYMPSATVLVQNLEAARELRPYTGRLRHRPLLP
ncbi:MAG TPA: hypothetical protein VFH06_04500 [Candidatus Saccharimonadales bacterium]|nr:hypothetical protein [Candidatus Saccharimonadales bacterium]